MTTTRKTTRPRRTTTTGPAVVRFPNDVLGYLQIALEGPLGPGGVAHRIKRYPVVLLDRNGDPCSDELVGPACGPTITRPGLNHDTNPDDVETIPATLCRSHSAGFAQAHGVTRCIQPACWPVQPGETPKAGTR